VSGVDGVDSESSTKQFMAGHVLDRSDILIGSENFIIPLS
jgi:hypothetical protein